MNANQHVHEPGGMPPPGNPSIELQERRGTDLRCPDVKAVSPDAVAVFPEKPVEPAIARQPKKLANQFASLDAEQTKKAFEDLDEAIRTKSEGVINALDTASQKSDELMQKISEMQSLLSQRGKMRRAILKGAGLPT